MTDQENLTKLVEDVLAYIPWGEITPHTAKEVADHLIENGVRLESKQATSDEDKRWIPVAERLPYIPDGWAEHPDPVLYMMKSTGMIYAGYYGENGVYRDKYFRQYADGREGIDAEDVRCWMWQHDLPEPPEDDC